MDKIELPTNVRQIGSIDATGLRIYVEDYVATFVQQYTQAHSGSEKLGILVGRYIEAEPNPILFISGAVEGKYSAEGDNGIEFSKKTNDYVTDILDKYFPGLKIVGWLQSQPGYGTYLSSKNYSYHKENFTENYQVFFVTDPVQRLDVFYAYNEENELCECKGYFVYYDKNKPMHEYMIDNRVQSSASVAAKRLSLDKSEELEESVESADEDIITFPISKRRQRELRESSAVSDNKSKKRDYTVRQTRQPTGGGAGQRRLVSMLGGLCAVMFLVSFIMGAGLIRSDERINVLEQNLASLNTAYRDLVAIMNRDANVPVFATEAPEVMAEIGLVVTEDGNRLLAEENYRASGEVAGASEIPSGTETAFAPIPAETAAIPDNINIPATYMVQAGDNLLSISQRIYGTPEMVERIMEVNNIEDADRIFFGQVLILPQP
ncbi:MAG: LysM peptidoglycan-binding domain-containing protein [Defluviitaleaceae bacterium]|nr:LysM peptidoglycan-binding domain-containing protein [Defluviitaleaceae bacterium]